MAIHLRTKTDDYIVPILSGVLFDYYL